MINTSKNVSNQSKSFEGTGSTAFVGSPDSSNEWRALIDYYKWGETVITYAFPTTKDTYPVGYSSYSEPANGFEPLNTTQIAVVDKLFGEIAGFTNLSFSKMSPDHPDAIMRFGVTDNVSTARGYLPYHSSEAAGDTWYNDIHYDSPVLGNFAYNEGFMHEIGHALGLVHGHDTSNRFGALDAAYDSNEFSVMTYRDHVGDSIDYSENETWGNPQTYMMLDIAALQYMYGADYSTSGNVWSGDSTYTFDPSTGEMSINGVGQGQPGGNRIFRTIWDGNGEDTYDLNNYIDAVLIDLRPGNWSTFSQAQLADLDGGSRDTNLARGNVANALLVDGDERSLIENAKGGTGNDNIFGNSVANKLYGNIGNDVLSGFDGNDLLFGEIGNDILNGDDGADYLDGGSGDDTLNGGSGDDLLYGYIGRDILNGGSGDDLLYGYLGRDILDGGEGTDTAKYDSGAEMYNIYRFVDRLVIAHFADGDDVDQLKSVERLEMNNVDFAVTTIQDSGSILEYAASYGDLAAAYGTDQDALQNHFANYGLVEGRTIIFDSRLYLGAYDDLRAAYGNDREAAANHFLNYGVNEGRSHLAFDALEYIASYGDLIDAFGANAETGKSHFLNYGFDEGRHESFNPFAYIASYGDLIGAFGSDDDTATWHFIEYGYDEGRATTFDAFSYVNASTNGDLLAAFGTDYQAATLHYINFGYDEGRDIA